MEAVNRPAETRAAVALDPARRMATVTAQAAVAAPELGLVCGAALAPEVYAELRLRTIFECGKFDPQVGDVAALCPYPLVLAPAVWRQLQTWAEALAAETLALETELLARPELQRELGLPWAVRRALRPAAISTLATPEPAAVRVMRFDFHPTAEGWRVSEVNSDVPGGFIESGGFTELMAQASGAGRSTGNPGEALARALAEKLPAGARIGLVHATGYSDDWQVMRYLARLFEPHGVTCVLLAPDQLRWRAGRAESIALGGAGPLDCLLRFFPGEWLPNLPRACGWRHWFAGSRMALSNPATALISQSKRLPLVFDRLRAPSAMWRALSPESRDPRAVPASERPIEGGGGGGAWVCKPVFGRVGAAIGLTGVTSEKEWRKIRRSLWWWPRAWVAQRRFEALALEGPAGPVYPCLGVYTIDGRAAGIYGRLARRPLIDDQAQDVAVLVAGVSAAEGGGRR